MIRRKSHWQWHKYYVFFFFFFSLEVWTSRSVCSNPIYLLRSTYYTFPPYIDRQEKIEYKLYFTWKKIYFFFSICVNLLHAIVIRPNLPKFEQMKHVAIRIRTIVYSYMWLWQVRKHRRKKKNCADNVNSEYKIFHVWTTFFFSFLLFVFPSSLSLSSSIWLLC